MNSRDALRIAIHRAIVYDRHILNHHVASDRTQERHRFPTTACRVIVAACALAQI